MDRREALIQINQVRGLGPAMTHRLMKAMGSPEAALRAAPAAWRETLGRWATDDALEGLVRAGRGEGLAEELDRAERAGVRIVTLEDDGYPALLREIADPPPALYLRGELLPEDEAAVAIVGTRAATPYGLSAACEIARELARAGVTVVSGLAEGIDAAAHEGALEAGGRTLAVVGHGLSTVYPERHRGLAARIAKQGAVISEFPMGTAPAQMNFPRRNRVIAGLSLAVVVAEAPLKSGALITAREAAEQGRDVFALPGPITAWTSQGANRLIKDGAGVVVSAEELLRDLAPDLRRVLDRCRLLSEKKIGAGHIVPGTDLSAGLSGEEARVFERVPTARAVGVEALAVETDLPPARLLPVLTGLEIKGMVRQMPGRGFTRSR